MSEIVKIFDTTLRDGEQSPGATMNIAEKVRIAQQLEKLNVDIIEAGFPISSEGDFEAVKAISQTIKRSEVAALARANPQDVDRAWEAIKKAKFHGYPTGQRSSIIVPFEFGPPKTSPIDLAVQIFDYNPDTNVYNNMKLGIINKNKLDKNLDQNYFIYVYVNGYLVFQNYCTGISKAETQQFFWFRWRPDKPGTYNYVIYIDPEKRLNDSNPENNTVRGTLVVK